MSSSPAAKTANVVFDPHGDCILVLPCSRGNTRFRVYSQILCHASPVFQAMLGTSSGFREGQTLASRSSASPPLDVPIADDDPPALATVLRILHRQYDWVPESITSDQLFHIAVICDKYDMRQALEDWLKKWLEKLTTNRSGDKWLFMAYAFQRADLFAKLSKELILNTSTSGFESFNRYIPESIIGMHTSTPFIL